MTASWMRRLAFGLSITLAFGGAQTQAQTLPEVIRIGDVGFGAGTPFGRSIIAIADAKGFIAEEFKDTPVKVEFAYYPGAGPALNEGFANGAVDFAVYGAVPNVIGRASGLDIRLVAPYAVTIVYAGARKADGITSLEDLKGKRIALQKATAIHLAALQALKRRGISDQDVTIVDLKSADQAPAFEAGSVDAIFGPSNFLGLVEKGVIDVIYNSKDDGVAGRVSGGLLASGAFLKAYPDASERVLRGYVRAAQWLADDANRDEAFGIWARSDVAVDILSREFEGVSFRDSFNPKFDQFVTAQYQGVIDFNRDNRLIRNDVDLAAFIDSSFLNKALSDLALTEFWPDRDAGGVPLAGQ